MARRPDPTWTARLDQDIEEMNRLVGELLNLARGLGQETVAQVDLADLLEELAERTRESGAEVRVRCPNLQLVVPPAALRAVFSCSSPLCSAAAPSVSALLFEFRVPAPSRT